MKRNLIQFSCGLAMICALTTDALALVTFDFTTGAVTSGTNYGNNIMYTSGSNSLKATSWADTGNNSTFETARIRSWGGAGIGSCNQDEGRNCSNPEHQVDNYLDNDYVLFVLDSTYLFDHITVDPYDTWDRDVTFWIGYVDPNVNLSGKSYLELAGLGFGPQQNVFNTRSSLAINIDLNNAFGNAVLVGPYKDETSSYYKNVDRFKIKALYAEEHVVPEPATMALFGTGLAGAFFRRKRSA
jgi:hypothetical protein